ncbi:MAG: Ig-like domain-containing protein, partial [Bifidobacteriaceae bacterium]|nr:Ig-like domain-containing protein [Bifidobacteriaceae bacterium]
FDEKVNRLAAFQLPAAAPAGPVTSAYVRARIDRRADVSAQADPLTDQSAQAWAGAGEVEDYRIGVANAVVRVGAKTAVNIPAHVYASLTNVSDQTPSSTGGHALTGADGSVGWFAQDHAVVDPSGAVTVTATGAGPQGAQSLNGWGLTGDTKCYDSFTLAPVTVTNTTSTLTLPAGLLTTSPDITCVLALGATVSAANSTLTVTPTPDPANPLAIGPLYYTAEVTGLGTVVNAAGEVKQTPMQDARIDFTLAPVGAAPSTGATFINNGTQSTYCILGGGGKCTVGVEGNKVGSYVLTAITSEGDQIDAQTLPFTAGRPTEATSSAKITQTADQPANHDVPGHTAATWGVQTITVALRDGQDNPVTDGAAGLSATLDPSDTLGLIYFADNGAFACSAALVAGVCPTGVYTLDVYSAKAGQRVLNVHYKAGQPSGFTVDSEVVTDGKKLITRFIAPEVSAGHSTLTVSPSTPTDNPDDPSDEPDGVPDKLIVGQSAAVRLTAWDHGRNNRIPGATASLTLSGATCHATFADGSGAVSGETSALGVFADAVTATEAGSCVLTALADGEAVAGSPKTITWEDGTVNPADPDTWFTVSTGEIVADGQDEGTVTVQLIGHNGYPVTTAAASLSAAGPIGGGVQVGVFTHQGKGVYTAAITSELSGLKVITAASGADTLNVKPVGGNDTAEFVAGPACATASWLIQPAGSAKANGTAGLTVGARVNDCQGNPVTSGQVQVALPAGVSVGAVPGPASLQAPINSAGLAQVQVTSLTAVDPATPYIVTAQVAGQAIANVKDAAEQTAVRADGQVRLVFTPDKEDPKNSRLSIPTAIGGATKVADGVESHRAEVALRDATNNPVPDGQVTIAYSYPRRVGELGTVTGEAVLTAGADGIAVFEFASEHATTWTIHATIDGEDVVDSPGTAVFEPDEASAGSTRLISPNNPAKADGVDRQTITAQVLDPKGNPIGGQTVTFQIPADTTSGGAAGPTALTAVTDFLGWASIFVTSTKVGSYPITAAVGALQITQGSPAQAVFANTKVDPGKSILSIPTAPGVKTVKTESHTAKAELFDGHDNIYTPPVDVVFFYKLSTQATWTQGPTLTSADGVALWTGFTVTKAGTYDVKAEIDGEQVGATQQCAFKAGPVDPPTTLASLQVDQTAVAANGIAQVRAWMTAQDEFANPVSGVTLGFSLLHAGVEGAEFGVVGGGKATTAVSAANGVAEVAIVSLFEGSYPVQGSLDGAVSQPPRPNANFTNDVPDPDKSEFAVGRTASNASPTKAIADGADSYTATIILRNAAEVAINGVGGTLYFTPAPGTAGQERAIQFTTGKNGAPTGTASVQLTTLKAGFYDVSVKIGADPVGTTPGGPVFTVQVEYAPGPVARAEFNASSGVALADDQATHEAAVKVFDANDNLISGQAVTYELRSDRQAHFTDPLTRADLGRALSLSSSALGLTSVLVSSPAVETTHLTARVDGAVVGEADFTFAADAPSPGDSDWVITPTGTRVADGVERFTATVTVRDGTATHSPVAGASVQFETAAGVVISPLGPYVSDQAGQVQVQFSSTQAGLHQVRAKLGADGIAPDPSVLEFVAGEVAPDHSTLSVTAGNVLANGTARHSAWVIARDQFDNPVAGQEVSFTVAQGAAAVAGPVFGGGTANATAVTCDPAAPGAPDWCDDKGKALVYVTSDEPGSFAVAGVVAGVEVEASPQNVTFESGPPTGPNSSYEITPLASAVNTVAVPATGRAADSYTLTVTARSAAGLLAPGAAVRLTGLPAGVVATPSATGFTGSPAGGEFGTFTWRLTSASVVSGAGQVEVNTTGGWEAVGESFWLRFSGGAPNGATSELTSPRTPGRANGEGVQVVRATLRDASGEPAVCWQGSVEVACEVSFQIPAGTWVGQGADRIDGPASVKVKAATSDVALGAGVAQLTVYGLQGDWNVFGEVAGAPIAKADGVANANGDARPAVISFTDATPPKPPTVNPPNAEHVSGVVHNDDLPDASGSGLTVVVRDTDGQELARCAVKADGTFDCEVDNLKDGTVVHVTVEDSAANVSPHTPVTIDAVAPVLAPAPSDGDSLSGRGDQPGDTIVVKNSEGEELCRTTVKDDLTWSCELRPTAKEGDKVTIVEIDPAANQSEKTWRIGLPGVTLAKASVVRGDPQTAVGENFQPGEEVSAVMRSDPLKIGQAVADSDGRVEFTWTVAKTTALGPHEAELSGPLSGTVKAGFAVVDPVAVPPLPITGASGALGLLGAALGLALAGWWLLAAARRRRRETVADVGHL